MRHLAGYTTGGRAAYAPAPTAYPGTGPVQAAAAVPQIDYGQLAEAMSRAQIVSPVVVDNRTVARIVGAGQNAMNRGR